MSKSSQAFRTIREVADWLGVAAHVLRFWESKFPQIKPVKRAGGRRYYRPADMELVGGIKVLLHDRGMTIRGVQKMLREDGVAAIAALAPPMHADDSAVIDGDAVDDWVDDAERDSATGGDDMTDTASDPQGATAEPPPDAAADMPTQSEAPKPEPENIAARVLDPQEPDAQALGALAARLAHLSPAQQARLRPALAALRDRMQAAP